MTKQAAKQPYIEVHWGHAKILREHAEQTENGWWRWEFLTTGKGRRFLSRHTDLKLAVDEALRAISTGEAEWTG